MKPLILYFIGLMLFTNKITPQANDTLAAAFTKKKNNTPSNLLTARAIKNNPALMVRNANFVFTNDCNSYSYANCAGCGIKKTGGNYYKNRLPESSLKIQCQVTLQGVIKKLSKWKNNIQCLTRIM